MIDNNLITANQPQLLNKSIKIGPIWEFSRPHTILGTTITVIAMFLITSANLDLLTQMDFIYLTLTLISSLLANVYIVGINQIYDVDIDKINKPYLPIAAGEISVKQAKILVVLSAILSLAISILVSFYLTIVVILGMLIGTAYSIPKTRFKTKPFLASFSISFVRGVLGNIGLYLSYESVLSFTRPNIGIVVIFLTIFILINSSVIAIFKDIPDIEGDKKYNIRTFSVRLGQQKIFSVSIFLIMANYLFAMIAGLLIQGVWDQFLVITIHLVVMLIFFQQSRKVIINDKISIWRFYKKIWKFFYLEYFILALVVLI